MTNTALLKSIMALHGDENFVKCLSELLNITTKSASCKLMGKSPFKQKEIAIIAKHYSLSGEQVKKIFVEGD